MKKNPLLIGIGLLAAIAAVVFVLFGISGLDPHTGLVQNQTLLWLSHLLFLACLVLSLIPGILYFPEFFPKKSKYEIEEKPKDMHPLIPRVFVENTAIFFVAMVCVFLVVLLLALYALFVTPSAEVFLLVLFSFGAVWGVIRIAWGSLAGRTKSSDAVIFLFPVLFVAYFCIYEYRLIAIAPQTSVYYAEIFAIILSLLSVLHFMGHCFGRTPNGSCFFLALSSTIFSASVYLSLLIHYCMALYGGRDTMTDSFILEGTRVMVFAALAIWNGIYAVALWKNRTVLQK